MTEGARVLVVGPRAGLLTALRAMGIPFAVWSERARSYRDAAHVHVAAITDVVADAERQSNVLAAVGPFTHVIAGTEAAVVPAAIARRAVGARYYPHTTVIRCHDKLHMKRHLAEHGIETTPFLDGDDATDVEDIVARLGTPVVVKARGLSGGRDVSVVHDVASLTPERVRGHILERFVAAPEASVESFINNGDIHFENVTEYRHKGTINVVPGKVDPGVHADMIALNRRVTQALNVRWGMTHLEMYLTENGPLFGEIAVRPPGGYIMDLLELAWGFDAWHAYVAMEIDRAFAFPDAPRGAAAAVVLHPGEGVVTAVDGTDRLRSHPHVVSVRVRVSPGDRVHPRTGVGVDVGRVLLCAPAHPALTRALATVEAGFRIEVQKRELS